jgi:hypothetical protein
MVGADGRRLAERLREAPGWRRRFALLDRFLLGRLDRDHPDRFLAQTPTGRRGRRAAGQFSRKTWPPQPPRLSDRAQLQRRI